MKIIFAFIFIVTVLFTSIVAQDYTADYWLHKGDEFYKKSSYDLALRCYDKAIELDPRYVDAWAGKGLALNALGRTTEANKAIDKAANYLPNLQPKEPSGTVAGASKTFGVQGNLVDRNFDGLQDILELSPESTVMAYWINLIPSQNLTDAATAALPESLGLTYGSQIYSTKVERMAGIYFNKTSLEFHWIQPFKVGYNGLVIPYEGYIMIPAGSEYAMVMGKPVLFGTQDAEKQVIDVIAGGLSAGDFTLVDDHQADLQVEALGRGGASMPLSGGYKEFYLGVSVSKDQANGFDLYAKYLQPSGSVNQRVLDIAEKNSLSYTTKGTDSELSGFVPPEKLPNVLMGLLKP